MSPNKATEEKRRFVKEYQIETSQVSLDGKTKQSETKQIAPKVVDVWGKKSGKRKQALSKVVE